MGFMDKANKLAGQAQAKIDEKLQQVNERLAPDPADQGPPVEYDQHGRPVRAEPAPPPAESATPPHGDPVAPPPAPEPGERQSEYEPPKLTGGDPLAG
jgi:hypothetical protein